MTDERPLANRLTVLQNLKGVDWPATRDELVTRARNNSADEVTLHALEHLAGERYDSPEQLAEAIGGDLPSSGMQGGPPHSGEPQADQARPGQVSDATESVDTLPGSDRL
jgi:hypothetical protein